MHKAEAPGAATGRDGPGKGQMRQHPAAGIFLSGEQRATHMARWLCGRESRPGLCVPQSNLEVVASTARPLPIRELAGQGAMERLAKYAHGSRHDRSVGCAGWAPAHGLGSWAGGGGGRGRVEREAPPRQVSDWIKRPV